MNSKITKQTDDAAAPITVVACPGHGVIGEGKTGPDSVSDPTSWKGIFPGEQMLLIKHIERAVQVAAECHGVFVPTGGQTREEAGPRSEALSYFETARDHSWFGHPQVGQIALIEEFARDSLENVLFVMLAFFLCFKRWPAKLIVVGWEFKGPRFNLHRAAVGLLNSQFEYVGVNDPAELEVAQAGEKKKVDAVRQDPYLAAPEWALQRQGRDPFGRLHPYRGLDAAADRILDLMERNAQIRRRPWL